MFCCLNTDLTWEWEMLREVCSDCFMELNSYRPETAGLELANGICKLCGEAVFKEV